MSKIFNTIIICAALIGTLSTAIAEGGLAERRAIKAFQEQKFVQVEKDIDSAAGFDVKVTVDWDKLARPGESELYSDEFYFLNTIFYPIIDALKDITRDEMGKSSLKEKLQTIAVTLDDATAPANDFAAGVSFKNGTLTVNFRPYSNTDARGEPNFKERVSAIVKELEGKL